MPTAATFLHVTDTHLSDAGTPHARDDQKVKVATIAHDTREASVARMFARLAEQLIAEGRQLDGVIFSGDAQDRGKPGGHKILLDLLLKHFGTFGITPQKIVAVPGNHDVPMGSEPSTAARYEPFLSVWRAAGCVTPWIDGVDAATGGSFAHRLDAPDGRWAIYAINSSNWSHTRIDLPEPLASVWDNLSNLAARSAAKRAELKSQLEKLRVYDMARVSAEQLEALRPVFTTTPPPTAGHQVRIAVLHHHLRAPSQREELKPFAEVSNLEQVRNFLRTQAVDVVVHGHKHEHAANYDHIYDAQGNAPHRTLVISGATFEPGREDDAARLITIDGLPFAPRLEIQPLPAPRGGQDPKVGSVIARRLWAGGSAEDTPVTVVGSDLDMVYTQAMEAASHEASGKTLIVHLDLPAGDAAPLPAPSDYPFPPDLVGEARQAWFQDLVDWWQLERSHLEHRVPYLHGARIKRFGGKINQLKRVVSLLKRKASTRALAVLVDPFRDFTESGDGEVFASFCLVEFKRRAVEKGKHAIDAIAFYRAQEFARWWPINVAELRQLQSLICTDLGANFRPGLITTVTADARTYARTPSQVAMPIIDRWLDQAPQMHFLLADALVQGGQPTGLAEAAVKAWRRTLAELEEAAKGFNPDGIPIAVDGLLQLVTYLRTADGKDADLDRLTDTVERLARTNASYNRSPDSARFSEWAPIALEAIRDLRRLTDRRTVGSPAISP